MSVYLLLVKQRHVGMANNGNRFSWQTHADLEKMKYRLGKNEIKTLEKMKYRLVKNEIPKNEIQTMVKMKYRLEKMKFRLLKK